MLDRHQLAQHLRELASLVESCSDEQLLAVEAFGLAALSQRPKKPARLSLQAPKPAPTSDELVRTAIEDLKTVQTREDARAILSRPKTNVAELTRIGKALGVAIKAKTPKDKIIAGIIEFHVGAGLNSQAMQPAVSAHSWEPR